MNSPDALMLQFLQWISLRRRTYSDVMEAWRSSCPRLTVWEDALESGLVEVQGRADAQATKVPLSEILPHLRQRLGV